MVVVCKSERAPDLGANSDQSDRGRLCRPPPPPRLRMLDAIHLATALYVDADEVVAYDRRLLDAAEEQGLSTAAPGTS